MGRSSSNKFRGFLKKKTSPKAEEKGRKKALKKAYTKGDYTYTKGGPAGNMPKGSPEERIMLKRHKEGRARGVEHSSAEYTIKMQRGGNPPR